MNIASIISYCSNEKPFLRPSIEQVLKFSKNVFVAVSTHFFDGEKEDENRLFSTFSQNPEVTFILYPFILSLYSSPHLFHSLSRYLGFYFARGADYLLFLDADETVDGSKFKSWLETSDYQEFNVMKMANYWYFRDIRFQAKTFQDSPVFVKREAVSKKALLHVEERDAIYALTEGPKKRNVMGLDGKPMIHHYSWVRTKEAMLKKVRAWGHRGDRDWERLVEEEFSHPFLFKDFVSGYEYEEVDPFIHFEENLTRGAANIIRLSQKNLLKILYPNPLNRLIKSLNL